jgi:acetoacetyl-CoA synthetase
LTRYAHWLRAHYGYQGDDYASLWQWSVTHTAAFWESLWEFFGVVAHSGYHQVMSKDPMPHVRWFEGATLNYAEHIFRNKTTQRPALICCAETRPFTEVSWQTLEEKTAALQAFFMQCGLREGDRVAAYMPNIEETTVSLLATLSLGAVWSSCSPDFGADSVRDRFQQIAPRVLIAVDGYTYNGKAFDRTDTLQAILGALPSVETVILVPFLANTPSGPAPHQAVYWDEVMQTPHQELTFRPVPFSHPQWVLYSSGTTGIPKAITHSQGGMLLEHLKYLVLHNDVRPGDRFFWYSTTGWMMWNFLQASLLAGATAVLYEGSAAYPDLEAMWRLAEQARITHFGTSAPFLTACMKAGLQPGLSHDFSALRSVGSTGAPLPPEGFDYVYHHIKRDLWLCSMSGGTDICTAWVGANPWRPVYAGEIQCRCLGCAMYAYDEAGRPLTGSVGEMVVTQAMPCMPIYFWNDPDFSRYLQSYFEDFPGVWRHGDWLLITERDSLIILGRSDATLNRQGVRIGTAEVYRAVDRVEAVRDSLVVNVSLPDGRDYMPLFVMMQPGYTLDEHLRDKIVGTIRSQCSPRHVPDEVIAVGDIPYTISGKKMEMPVKRILSGTGAPQAASRGAMRNPEALEFFQAFAQKLRTATDRPGSKTS